jgi:uncharacterized protein
MRTVLLLLASNCFMTLAWYWHLRKEGDHKHLIVLILLSWLIALPEYCLAVPANRYGHVKHGGDFTAPQLKIIQEAISLGVFFVFSFVVLRETPTWRDGLGMILIFAGVLVALSGGGSKDSAAAPAAAVMPAVDETATR